MKTDTRRNIIFAVSLALVSGTAFVGGHFTRQGSQSAWYESVKPALAPPAFVFPLAWSALYLALAAALALTWLGRRGRARLVSIGLFAVNLVLNAAWSYVYFGRRNPPAAFLVLLALWVSTLMIMIQARRARPAVFFLLLPYLLWLSFAGILNRLSF